MNNDVMHLPVKFTEEEIQDSPHFIKILKSFAETISIYGVSRNKEEEIKCHIKEVKQKQIEYLQSQLLTKAIQDTVCSSKLSELIPTKKMQEMIVAVQLSNYININPESNEELHPEKDLLFGISCLSVSDNKLSPHEFSSFKFALEETLASEATKHIPADISQFSMLTERHEEKLELLNLKLERDTTLKIYNETLIKCKLLCEEFIQQRTTHMKETIPKKLKYLLTKIDLNLLKAKVHRLQILVDFYEEDENVIEAFNKISNSLESATKSTYIELITLKSKLDAYEKLRGTQFDKILNKYLVVRKSINEKMWILDELNKS